MCCFSTKTEVSQTNIFARAMRPGVELVVYQMRYTSAEPTAMILPLPVALPSREGAVRWKSLKEAPTFFEQLASGFPEIQRAPSGAKGVAVAAAAAPLAVHEVGDFV